MTTSTTTLLTYDDLLAMPEDGLRHEIIDGALFVSPAPAPNHQQVIWRLIPFFQQAVPGPGTGEVYLAPVDVMFEDTTVVKPDMLFVQARRVPEIIATNRIVGAPDLVLEVISPSSMYHDRVRKFELYERMGVPEYWIVHPEKREISVHVLIEGRYQVKLADPDGTFTSRELPGLRIDPNVIF